MKIEWHSYVDRWHDQRFVCHIGKTDASPACGASYYMSLGANDPFIQPSRKCKRCLRMQKKLESKS